MKSWTITVEPFPVIMDMGSADERPHNVLRITLENPTVLDAPVVLFMDAIEALELADKLRKQAGASL